jgi:hypothetical protein
MTDSPGARVSSARRPLTRRECGEAGILARLLTEDWTGMTAAARAAKKHVNSLERWFEKAKEANPNLTDEQAARLAEKMRLDHFRRMGRLSGEARKLARETQTELERAGGVAGSIPAQPHGAA